MGDAMGEGMAARDQAPHSPLGRPPLGAMTTPECLALEVCERQAKRVTPPAALAVPLPRCTVGHPAARRRHHERLDLGPGAAGSSGVWLALRSLMPAASYARRPLPVAATASALTKRANWRGDGRRDRRRGAVRGLPPPRARPPRDAMTTPERLAPRRRFTSSKFR